MTDSDEFSRILERVGVDIESISIETEEVARKVFEYMTNIWMATLTDSD